jgi:hypothetical protein
LGDVVVLGGRRVLTTGGALLAADAGADELAAELALVARGGALGTVPAEGTLAAGGGSSAGASHSWSWPVYSKRPAAAAVPTNANNPSAPIAAINRVWLRRGGVVAWETCNPPVVLAGGGADTMVDGNPFELGAAGALLPSGGSSLELGRDALPPAEAR